MTSMTRTSPNPTHRFVRGTCAVCFVDRRAVLAPMTCDQVIAVAADAGTADLWPDDDALLVGFDYEAEAAAELAAEARNEAFFEDRPSTWFGPVTDADRNPDTDAAGRPARFDRQARDLFAEFGA